MGTGLSLVLFAVVSTAFLAFLGYGPAKLLLPREWRSEEGYLAPLLGYALLLLVGYYGVRTWLNLTGVLILCSVLAVILNGLALWRRRGERLGLDMREHGVVWLIAFAAFLLAVLPLLHYGYLTPIGENWDPENYLPVTEYLVQVPLDHIEEMPPNPLRDLNADPPRIGLTLGFSVVQGVLQQLRGWDARQSFAPTIALLRGLTALAWYGLFRRGLRMGKWAGLLAAFFAGLHALGLWIAFFNFGMQMAATPLVPLALTLFLAALRRPSWRTVVPAAASVAALPVAYYPALTVFVPVALGLGLYEVLRAERRAHAILAGLGTALLAAGLAWGTILDYGAGFSYRYSQQMTTLGLFHFMPTDQLLGFTPFSRKPELFVTPGKALQIVGVGLIVLLILAALWRSRQRWRWLAALLPGILYLGWLRGWFWPLASTLKQRGLLETAIWERFRPYPYAYMKGTVFVAPLVLALAVEGCASLWNLVKTRLQPARLHPWQIVLAGLLLLPAGLTLWSDGRLVARYWERPAHFDHEALQVEEAASLLPEEATVYLTGRPERSRPVLGLFAYFLRDHPVYGRFNTAYTGWDRRVPGDAPTYALLDADDDPHALGFSPSERIWAGGGMALYRRDAAVLSFLDLRADAYGQRSAEAIHVREPLADRLLSTFGPYPDLSPEDPLVLFADAERISRSDDLAGVPGERSLLLSFAAFEPATVTLRWDDDVVEEFALPPGFSLYRSRPHPLPARAEIAPQGAVEVWPCWVALLDVAGEAEVQSQPEVVALIPEATADGKALQVDLRTHNETGRPLRLALEVWENTFQSARHYAWWGLLHMPERGTVRLQADLAGRTARAWVGGQEVPFEPHPGAEAWPEVADGSYFAALWVYYGHHVIEVLPVGQFRIIEGHLQDLSPIDLSARLLWPHSLAEPSGARFGAGIELAAYERGAGPFDPGDVVPLALEWHVLDEVPVDYFVTAQILGQGRLWGQWDGPAGQWRPASAWQVGEYIRDDIPLQVDPATSSGRYRLIVAVYDGNTGQRLMVYSTEGKQLGDFLDLGEIVVR